MKTFLKCIPPVWDVLQWVRGIRLDLHRSETLRKGNIIESRQLIANCYEMIPLLEGLL